MTMNKIQLRLISFFFDAILPPKNVSGHSDDGNNSTNDSYYACLDVAKSCTVEDIRNAYKKKSLQYHPDKIAQFASIDDSKNEKEVQADFFLVKDAYETLSDPHKRDAYDVLGKEGGKLLNQGEGRGPHIFEYQTMMQNLARSSLYSKTKFMLFIIFISLIIVATPTLICLKVDERFGMQGLRWVWVFTPIWFLNILILSYTISSQKWLGTLKMICITTGELLLTLKWDKVMSWDYVFLLTPFYLLHIIILVANIQQIRNARKNVDKIVTVPYLEECILPIFREERQEENSDRVQQWCSYNNLTERERDIINKEYIIIDDQSNFDDNVSNESFDPETKLCHTIMMSHEYEAAIKMKSRAIRNIVSTLICTAFLVLLVLKLDRDKHWNWFLIFSPILFQVSLILFPSCWTFCCYGVISEEIVDKDSVISIISRENSRRRSDTLDNDNASIRTEEEKDSGKTKNKDVLIDNGSIELVGNDFVCNPSIQSSTDKHESTTNQDVDSESIEKGAKAFLTGGACTVFAVFLTFLLIKSNGAEDETDSWNDYSAFWVALPLFMVMGMLLFCICVCVCCAAKVEPLESTQYTADDVVECDSDVALQGYVAKTSNSDDSDDSDDLD